MVRRTPRLSTRVTLSFGIIAFIAGIALTVLAYVIARNSLVDQRSSAAQIQAFSNARDLQLVLGDPDQVSEAFDRL
ncbi:MAG TPA: hypothetical protein VGK49_03665, partial [Ilumatobacteraceae bacterium]